MVFLSDCGVSIFAYFLDLQRIRCFIVNFILFCYSFFFWGFVQINEFVKLGGDQLVPYYADILGAILPCISDKEEKIRVVGCFALPHLVLPFFFFWGGGGWFLTSLCNEIFDSPGHLNTLIFV